MTVLSSKIHVFTVAAVAVLGLTGLAKAQHRPRHCRLISEISMPRRDGVSNRS